jgi:hypothetical protein
MPKKLASVSWKQNKQDKQDKAEAEFRDRYHAVLGWIVGLIILGSLLSGTLAFAIFGGISRSGPGHEIAGGRRSQGQS